MSNRSILLIATPPGDAPLWVREKWVGLNLPIVGTNSRRLLGVSVKEKNTVVHHLWAVLRGRAQIITGYKVEAGRAVGILAASNPEAAEWWRQNKPGYLQPGRFFVFHAKVCQLNEA